MIPPRPPTSTEADKNTKVVFTDQSGHSMTVYGAWYPQMGGYCGLCWIEPGNNPAEDCFDVWVWHDGEFPFREGREPYNLHHCAADQFIEFGEKVKGLGKSGE